MSERESGSLPADKPRASYVPLSRETIEAWREHLLDIEQRPDESAEIDRLCDMAVNALLYAEEIERLRTRSAVARPIEAEVGKYPMRGDELLAILRGIADDEDKGVDKDRRRGAKWACFRCISAVESWLRCAQSASEAFIPNPSTLWVVWFEDKDHPPEVFFGDGAESSARLRYKQAYDNWSCHLLVRVPTRHHGNSVGPDNVTERVPDRKANP